MTTATAASDLPIVGWIEVQRTWPGIDVPTWLRLVSTVDGLKPKPGEPARAGTNPFTKGPVIFAPRPPNRAHALVVVDGDVVGEMRLVRDGPSEIRVFGDRALVRAIAQVAATQLGGSYLEMP